MEEFSDEEIKLLIVSVNISIRHVGVQINEQTIKGGISHLSALSALHDKLMVIFRTRTNASVSDG